jgi:PAS domain S-box-containing protein
MPRRARCWAGSAQIPTSGRSGRTRCALRGTGRTERRFEIGDKGNVEATYRFGPSDHPWRASETRLESEIRDGDRVIARLAVAGRTTEYDQEDKASLQIIGAEALHLVLRIRQARKLEIQSRVLQSAVNGIVITDPEGHVECANPAFERINGYALEEILGRDLRFLRSGEQDDAFFRRLWDTITDGRSFTGEFVNRRKDGNLVTIEQIVTPVIGPGGQIEKFISISEDITERKSVEEPTRAVPTSSSPRPSLRCGGPRPRPAAA